VERRHRGELVGDRLGVVGRVDVGPVHVERVDEPGHHPRRGERVGDVDRERRCGDADQPVPHGAVPVGPADEQPQHERDRDREVDADVVAVEEPDQRLAAERELLHGALRHEPAALHREHVAGVGERVIGVVAGEEANLAVADEQRRHERDLADERPAGERGDPRRERSVFGPDRVLSQYLTHVVHPRGCALPTADSPLTIPDLLTIVGSAGSGHGCIRSMSYPVCMSTGYRATSIGRAAAEHVAPTRRRTRDGFRHADSRPHGPPVRRASSGR
jgi:hypothetical protein